VKRKRRKIIIDSSHGDSIKNLSALDEDLRGWCEQMGLQSNGQPLSGMDAAKRAHEQSIADEVREAEQPRYKIPFYKLPFARDL